MDRVQRVLALDDQVERALWLSRARALRDPREEPAGREPAHGDGITRIDLRTLARRPEGVRLSSLVFRERGAVSSDFDRDRFVVFFRGIYALPTIAADWLPTPGP